VIQIKIPQHENHYTDYVLVKQGIHLAHNTS